MENEQEKSGIENENLDNVGQDNENTDNEQTNDNSESDNVGQDKSSDNNNDLYGAPETYDFKSLELPEGVQYNEEYGNKFSAVAKELNLSQNSANKLINVYVDILKSQTGNVPDAIKEIKDNQVKADVAEWDKAVNQDTEIGNGNKDKINQYIDKANVGYETFASEGLKNILSERGLTHHPEVIKLFYKLSDLGVEDKILTGGDSEKDLTPAQILYGKA